MQEADIECPFCGETISLLIDTSVPLQSYIEDCAVCCKPIQVRAVSEDGGVVSVEGTPN